MIEWECLVEANIDSIHMSVLTKKIEINFQTSWQEKIRRKISASGVVDFFVDDLRLSNIVDKIYYYAEIGESNEIAVRQYLSVLMGGRMNLDQEWAPLQNNLQLIKSGALKLVVIEPVYGATAIILAKDIWLE